MWRGMTALEGAQDKCRKHSRLLVSTLVLPRDDYHPRTLPTLAENRVSHSCADLLSLHASIGNKTGRGIQCILLAKCSN